MGKATLAAMRLKIAPIFVLAQLLNWLKGFSPPMIPCFSAATAHADPPTNVTYIAHVTLSQSLPPPHVPAAYDKLVVYPL